MNDPGATRPLPVNGEVEQALLGAVLVNNDAFGRVAGFLKAEHFAEPVHRAIYEVAGQMVRVGRRVTPQTIKTFLPADLAIGDINLATYLARLAAEAVTVLNAEDWGRTIRDLATARDLISVMSEASDRARNTPVDVGGLVTEAIARLQELQQHTDRRSSLRLTMFDQIEHEPKKKWLVRDLLGAGELSAIFGAPGSGKSALAGDIAAHIAAGLPWMGRAVQQGAVLYVAAERADLVKRRFAAWRRRHEIEALPLAVLAGLIDFRTSAAVADEVVQHTRDLAARTRTDPVFVVVDTYSRALAGGDENSPKDAGQAIMNVSRIQEATGAHVCLLHHVPQDGVARMRGHGLVLGAMDTTIAVAKLAVGRSATVEKANDGEEGLRIGFDLESVTLSIDGKTGQETTAPVVVQAEAPQPERSARRLPDRVKAALDVLSDLCLEGEPLKVGNGLPAGIRAVTVETWRSELYMRGALDAEHKNPREDFKRVKTALLARNLIAERAGQIWAV